MGNNSIDKLYLQLQLDKTFVQKDVINEFLDDLVLSDSNSFVCVNGWASTWHKEEADTLPIEPVFSRLWKSGQGSLRGKNLMTSFTRFLFSLLAWSLLNLQYSSFCASEGLMFFVENNSEEYVVWMMFILHQRCAY